MTEIVQNIGLALIGLVLGYVSSLLIAKYNAKMALHRELKNAIAQDKVAGYLSLWKLCDGNITSSEMMGERLKALQDWYKDGGGLFLPFKATDHFFGAIKLLSTQDIRVIENLKKEFTWMRTEMKFEVGSYSRKEADTNLPNTK